MNAMFKGHRARFEAFWIGGYRRRVALSFFPWAAMSTLLALTDTKGDLPVVAHIAAALAFGPLAGIFGGAVFGVLFTFFARRGWPASKKLTRTEREAVVRAVSRGETPPDQRLVNEAFAFAATIRQKTDQAIQRSRQSQIVYVLGLVGLVGAFVIAVYRRDFAHASLMLGVVIFWHFGLKNARRYLRWVNEVATDVTIP